MIRLFVGVVCVLCCLSAQAQKKIYIPEDLRGMDLQADTSKWSFKRSIETDDLILMWERGFNSPPKVGGARGGLSNGIVSGPLIHVLLLQRLQQ